MKDVIRLLPDHVANKIAAGEVVQRPASVVKELLENAIDANASFIKLIIKDAGKTLIRVVDDGDGMSTGDARLSFERHATSKINDADDLFSIRSKGFRGEALASIGSISHVEMKTCRAEDELGTHLEINGSQMELQEFCQTPVGTSISVRNIFYNVPARRKFLKSDPVELRHMIDEFHRVALAHPDISFSMHHNDSQLYHLEKGNLRKRIVAVHGPSYNDRILPLGENCDIVDLNGFVGKPEFSRKTRGEQFIFVNDRYIKNSYLNHAVFSAYEELIPKGNFPTYFLYLNLDPSKIDINIHPTKTEIKFEDEKTIYSIVRSAVRQSLGKFNAVPSLDFDSETCFDTPPLKKGEQPRPPEIKINKSFNPFADGNSSQTSSGGNSGTSGHQEWQKLYEGFEKVGVHHAPIPGVGQQDKDEDLIETVVSSDMESEVNFRDHEKMLIYQLHSKYILAHVKSGFMIIHQHRAHERILYEQFNQCLDQNSSATQQLLFPETIEMNVADYEVVKSFCSELQRVGLDIRDLGGNSLIVYGVPAILPDCNVRNVLDKLVDNYENDTDDIKEDALQWVAYSLARNLSIKEGRVLQKEEMESLIDQLFATEMPNIAVNGKPIITMLTLDELNKRFN